MLVVDIVTVAIVAVLTFHAEHKAREARNAAARSGIAHVRSRQAADDSERAAYGQVVTKSRPHAR